MADEAKPPETIPETTIPETIEVDDATVACDGGALGHPRVYLDLAGSGAATCPYCDQRFVLKPGAGAATGH